MDRRHAAGFLSVVAGPVLLLQWLYRGFNNDDEPGSTPIATFTPTITTTTMLWVPPPNFPGTTLSLRHAQTEGARLLGTSSILAEMEGKHNRLSGPAAGPHNNFLLWLPALALLAALVALLICAAPGSRHAYETLTAIVDNVHSRLPLGIRKRIGKLQQAHNLVERYTGLATAAVLCCLPVDSAWTFRLQLAKWALTLTFACWLADTPDRDALASRLRREVCWYKYAAREEERKANRTLRYAENVSTSVDREIARRYHLEAKIGLLGCQLYWQKLCTLTLAVLFRASLVRWGRERRKNLTYGPLLHRVRNNAQNAEECLKSRVSALEEELAAQQQALQQGLQDRDRLISDAEARANTAEENFKILYQRAAEYEKTMKQASEDLDTAGEEVGDARAKISALEAENATLLKKLEDAHEATAFSEDEEDAHTGEELLESDAGDPGEGAASTATQNAATRNREAAKRRAQKWALEHPLEVLRQQKTGNHHVDAKQRVQFRFVRDNMEKIPWATLLASQADE